MERDAAEVKTGGSLPVPCVQELAKDSPDIVPPRYLRRDDSNAIDPPVTYSNSIPTVDVAALTNGDLKELNNLDSACRDWGFFQLVNHGVNYKLMEEMKKQTHGFFSLPMEEKRKYWQVPDDIEGFGQTFVLSEEQKLDWGDMFYLKMLPAHLRKSRIFPELPPSFRETMETYSAELRKLALKIIHYQAKALKMDSEYARELFDQGLQAMRTNYYPPCPQPEKVLGLSPHSDAAALTILLQLSDVEGLQIKKDSLWIPVKPLPDAFVVNVGDSFEIFTNGIYRSIEHRAMVNSAKERLSIATFYSQRFDSEIGPAPSLISAENPAKFKRVEMIDYYKGFLARKLDGKSYLDEMRIPPTDDSLQKRN